jgi:hypothetical protein
MSGARIASTAEPGTSAYSGSAGGVTGVNRRLRGLGWIAVGTSIAGRPPAQNGTGLIQAFGFHLG